MDKKPLDQPRLHFQADVHFALGTVIQGVTMAALGSELADLLRSGQALENPWIWATAIQSFAICIVFWYSFMDNFYLGFRSIVLSATGHFLIASQYLTLGILQILAIRYIDRPESWFIFFTLILLVTLSGSLIRGIRHINVEDQKLREAIQYSPGIGLFPGAFIICCLLLVIGWIFSPDSYWYRIVLMGASGISLALFIRIYRLIFTKHLALEDELHSEQKHS